MDSISKARLERIKKYQNRKHVPDIFRSYIKPEDKLYSADVLERLVLPEISDKDRKDYYILFDTWKEYLTSESLTGFDTEKELRSEVELISEIYKDVKSPKVYKRPSWLPDLVDDELVLGDDYEIEFEDNQYFWGYIIIDFTRSKIKIYHDGLFDNCLNRVNHRGRGGLTSSYRFYELEDVLFRKSGEIPENYQWDGLEEYWGWLQFRWGDHKNSAKLVRNRKKPDISKVHTEIESERLQHKFDVELDKKLYKERFEKNGW